MPHRRGLGEHSLAPAAECELGRMRIRGEVSEPEETAGYVYGRMWRGYVATLDSPRGPGVGQGRVTACAGCPSPETRRWCLCDMRRRIYTEATGVLVSTGRGVAPLVRAVVVYDRQCPFQTLGMLKQGLTALAEHFGLAKRLTNHRKREYQKTSSNPRLVEP